VFLARKVSPKRCHWQSTGQEKAPIFIHTLHLLKGDELGASVKEADVETDFVDVPGGGGLHRGGVEGAGRVHHLPLRVDQVRAGCGCVDVTRRVGGGLNDVVGVVGGDEDGGGWAEVGGGRAGALVHRGSARIWCNNRR